ncbi:hypothetical protein SDC9_210414 [bioreactor metagenome]|uniref:Uncharacterized protein n=1 Tax=bioreactor metagenome TaxID=1076179 RepID=A0A645JHG5_9ZZZZ
MDLAFLGSCLRKEDIQSLILLIADEYRHPFLDDLAFLRCNLGNGVPENLGVFQLYGAEYRSFRDNGVGSIEPSPQACLYDCPIASRSFEEQVGIRGE